MKELILLRHAQSGWGDPGLKDFDRPLDHRGEKDVPTMAERLRLRGVQPQRIVSSPAKRAAETGRLLLGGLLLPETRLGLDPRIYEASTGELFNVIGEFDQPCQQILLIGHNPGLTDLSSQLCGLGIANLPPCAAVGIRLDLDRWSAIGPGCGEPWFYDFPEKPEAED